MRDALRELTFPGIFPFTGRFHRTLSELRYNAFCCGKQRKRVDAHGEISYKCNFPASTALSQRVSLRAFPEEREKG
jgi:hypothetical protein